MGLWDSFCSCVSSFCSSVCSAISSVCSAIGGAITSALSSLGELAGGIVTALKNIPGIEVITAVLLAADVIIKICDMLGLTTKDEPKKLGRKAHVYAQKVENGELESRDFKDTEEFIDYLNNEIDVNDEELENLPMEKQIGYTAVGLALQAKAIAEKLDGAELTPNSIATLTKLQNENLFDVNEFLTAVKQGISPHDYTDYLEGRGERRLETGEALRTALGDGAAERLLVLKDAVRKYDV